MSTVPPESPISSTVKDTAYGAISFDTQLEDDDPTEAVNFSFSVSLSATDLPHTDYPTTTLVSPSIQHRSNNTNNSSDIISPHHQRTSTNNGSNPSSSNSPSLTPITLADINANPSKLLSPETIDELSTTWDIVVSTPGGTSEFAKRFFSMMIIEARDNAKRMFAHLSKSTQEHMIRSVVRFAVTNNFHSEPLKHIGVVHAHLGVQREDFITFNRCFIETLRVMVGSEWSDHRMNVWRETMDLMASLMIPMSEEAEGLIAKVSHRSNGAGVVLGLHEKLMGYFQERLLPQGDGTFTHATDVPKCPTDIVDYCVIRAPLTFSHNLTFVERTLQPCGRMLYFVDTEGRPRCFVDLRHVRRIESISDTDSFLIVIENRFSDLTHYIRFKSEYSCELWLVQINQRWQQFNVESPIPTAGDLDKTVSKVFDSKQTLQFTPSDFIYLNILGKGSFGKVVKVQHKDTKRVYAMKIIAKLNFTSVRHVVEVRRERAMLESVECPFIVKFHGFFQSHDRLYFLFDFLSGGELFYHTKLAPNHHFDEPTCRFYVAEIACALEHLRVRRIVHRDIKGDNFVLDRDGHVVLTDFGFAKFLDTSKRNTATCGTLAYIAPEVLAPGPDGYNYEVDWWSLGVVLFTMLTGYFPFLRETPPETARAIVYDELHFPPNIKTSHRARSLCRHLMDKRPLRRISCLAKLKEHSFFADFDWDALESRQMKPPFVPESQGPNTKYFQPKYTDRTYEQHQGGWQSPLSPEGVDTDGPEGEDLPRQLNVFSSFFFEQEEYASELAISKVSKSQSRGGHGRMAFRGLPLLYYRTATPPCPPSPDSHPSPSSPVPPSYLP